MSNVVDFFPFAPALHPEDSRCDRPLLSAGRDVKQVLSHGRIGFCLAVVQFLAEMLNDGFKLGDKVKGKVLLGQYSRYMQQFPEALRKDIVKHGVRFTHHSSIAPTGTISLSLANNASN